MIYAKTTFENQVRCCNAERSICDLLRSRNRMDEETVISSFLKIMTSIWFRMKSTGEENDETNGRRHEFQGDSCLELLL